MEFSVKELLEAHRNELPELLRKSNLVKGVGGGTDQWELTKAEEIGDGNLNFVYRALLTLDGEPTSVIVKFAPTYIRCLGPSHPLTQKRLEVEYATMCQFNQFHPGSVPYPVLFDADRSAVIMEDLQGYNILRAELMEGHVEQAAIRAVMSAIGAIHRQTLQKNLPAEKWQEFVANFSNKDMVAITRDYVFTNPFQHSNPLNRHQQLLESAVLELRNDKAALERAAEMRRLFLEQKECLCHGDLHTGSVMVQGERAKMIDEEFAFVGPALFDFGMFLANLIFALIRHYLLDNARAKKRLWAAIPAAVDAYCSQCREVKDKDDFVGDVCGFAGVELIRRTIGTAHVEDLNTMPEGELIAVQLGHSFLVTDCSSSHGKEGLIASICQLLKQSNL